MNKMSKIVEDDEDNKERSLIGIALLATYSMHMVMGREILTYFLVIPLLAKMANC